MAYICIIASDFCWGSMDCLSNAVCIPEEAWKKSIVMVGSDYGYIIARARTREAAEKLARSSWRIVCGHEADKILSELGDEVEVLERNGV